MSGIRESWLEHIADAQEMGVISEDTMEANGVEGRLAMISELLGGEVNKATVEAVALGVYLAHVATHTSSDPAEACLVISAWEAELAHALRKDAPELTPVSALPPLTTTPPPD